MKYSTITCRSIILVLAVLFENHGLWSAHEGGQLEAIKEMMVVAFIPQVPQVLTTIGIPTDSSYGHWLGAFLMQWPTLLLLTMGFNSEEIH